ncbi:MAG: rodA [Rickettsiaceae bacterium]|nr:rodA [Rickettsiaceae bacterium]
MSGDLNSINSIKAKLKHIPYSLVLLITITCLYGFLILYSAGGSSFYPWAYKQIIFFLIFLPIMFFIAVIDIRKIFNYSYIFYLWVVVMLVLVHLLGHTAMGAKRWFSLGFIKIQPSEPAKIAIILMLARYFHALSLKEIGQIKYVIPAVIAVLIPVGLIVKQPDLGTGLITLTVSGIIFFIAGIRLWKFVVVIITAGVSMPIIWNFLYDYQKKRILMFLEPESDRLGAGYNIIQSKIAIGSGGFFGKGLFNGTQSQLEFLPEHQTDFIFSTLAEEMGFVGSFILLLLYFFITYLSLSIALGCKSTFGRLVVVGITSLFFFHVFINIGMVMGLLPAVGIPLPFMSYGGTMMGSMLIGFGLIFNVHVHQRVKISKDL